MGKDDWVESVGRRRRLTHKTPRNRIQISALLCANHCTSRYISVRSSRITHHTALWWTLKRRYTHHGTPSATTRRERIVPPSSSSERSVLRKSCLFAFETVITTDADLSSCARNDYIYTKKNNKTKDKHLFVSVNVLFVSAALALSVCASPYTICVGKFSNLFPFSHIFTIQSGAFVSQLLAQRALRTPMPTRDGDKMCLRKVWKSLWRFGEKRIRRPNRIGVFGGEEGGKTLLERCQFCNYISLNTRIASGGEARQGPFKWVCVSGVPIGKLNDSVVGAKRLMPELKSAHMPRAVSTVFMSFCFFLRLGLLIDSVRLQNQFHLNLIATVDCFVNRIFEF